MEYSETFKRKMVQRMLGPKGKSATELSKAVNVHQVTLSRWKREACTLESMATVPPSDTATKRPHTLQDKVRLVLAAGSDTAEELGARLRREGIHEAELTQWREAITAALDESKTGAATGKGAVQIRRIRHLERELKRKDKALAEAAALLLLQKKVRSIWADEDDDTTETNEP